MERYKQLLHILNDCLKIQDSLHKELLALSLAVGDIREEEQSRMPLHINVIKISAVGRLKETAHSAILQHMLQHQTILDSFIELVVGLKDVKVDSCKVRPAEKDRIDVSIYENVFCLIIENKVNDAEERTGQVYRYVELALEAGYRPEQIKVLYLNSNNYDKPTDRSLTKNGEGIKRIHPLVENNLVVKDYAHDIYEWLKCLQALLSDKEAYIKSALHQYIDYLEEYFYLSDKFNNMKERIKSKITESLLSGFADENDFDFSQRISALEDASENLQHLKDGVDALLMELSAKRNVVNIQKELSKLNLILIDMRSFGYDQWNFGARVSINGKLGFIAFGRYNSNEYIGFAFDTSSLTKTEKNYLTRLLKKLGKDPEEEDLWPCWAYIANTSLLNEYTSFVKYVRHIAERNENCPIEFVYD